MHINDVREILKPEKGLEVSLKCWTKDGSVMDLKRAVCIYNHIRGGTRRMKILPSMQTRLVRDYLIFECNEEEVFL